jgi:dynein heavy chain
MYDRYKNTSISEPSFINKPEFFLRMCFYKDEVSKYPKEDSPDMFGLHFNAEISANIQDSQLLINNIRLMSPELLTGGEGNSKEDEVLKKISIAKGKVPEPLVLDMVRKKAYNSNNKRFDPLLYLLIQEADRYNNLIKLIKSHLLLLESSLKGNTVLTPDLESDIESIYKDFVPAQWLLSGYISTKPFASYIQDLCTRVEFFSNWITHGSPFNNHYYLSYFCNPSGFIGTIKQKYAMETNNAFYQVTLEFRVINDDDSKSIPKSGYLIKGIFIEGGYWDRKINGLKDEIVQDLYNNLPTLLISPVKQMEEQTNIITNAIATGTGVIKHSFPLYYIPIRGTLLGKSSYVMDVNLPIIKENKDNLEKPASEYAAYWVRKGTCLLLSKND